MFYFLFLIGFTAFAQVGVGIITPDPSAQLDVVSTDKGVLISRVVSTSLINSPAKGLLVYQISDSEGFYYYDGFAWQKVGKETLPPGDTFAFVTNNMPIENILTSAGYIFRFGYVQIASGISISADSATFTLTTPGVYSISYNLAVTLVTNNSQLFYTELVVNDTSAMGSQADSDSNGDTRFSLTNFILTIPIPTTIKVRLNGPTGELITSEKLRTLSIIRLK